MIEERKKIEMEYYDKKARELLEEKNATGELSDFEGFKPQILSSFKRLYELLAENSKDKIILDYGCGNGVHSFFSVEKGAKKLIGIDISEKSLEIARRRAEKLGIPEEKIQFLRRDCEKTEFPDNYFDIVFDGGSFSSLDLKSVFPEIIRILKPGGLLIGIETFGHNPIANLKRKLNKVFGKRTGWAEAHILKTKDLKNARKYFSEIQVSFFHFFSYFAIPFLGNPGGGVLLGILEGLDKLFFALPFLRRYGFKAVFVFKKHD
ncbi:MAG: class I SAM-dependent methyltransferase [Candidatus Pacebacteria bacterium]|nr:class I SAM-dependent methyltransferase [Candidatus Paceibacterota bacterium]